jgi:hypothetical protein
MAEQAQRQNNTLWFRYEDLLGKIKEYIGIKSAACCRSTIGGSVVPPLLGKPLSMGPLSVEHYVLVLHR